MMNMLARCLPRPRAAYSLRALRWFGYADRVIEGRRVTRRRSVNGRAIRRDADLARGAVEKLQAQVASSACTSFVTVGFGHLQRVGGFG